MSTAEHVSQISAPHGSMREAALLFALSRRHALPFGVVALGMDAPDAPAQSEHWGQRRMASLPLVAQLEHIARSELRSTDVLVRSRRGEYCLVFCASTDRPGTQELCRRLAERGQSLGVRIGEASLHVDALSLADLISVACNRAGFEPPAEHESTIDAGLLEVSRSPQSRRVDSVSRRLGRGAKRIFDIAAVLAAAPFWLPVMAVIALFVKATDLSAPVLYHQPRTGRGGKRFEMLKFRTMVPNADDLKGELAHLNQRQWPDFKIERDPRITRVGGFLRRTSLDELPQLLNILRGEMSLVGPRPTSFASETYEPWQTARLDAVPGLTGLWQVEGRGIAEFDERLRLDLEYIDRQGFLFDLWLLIRTIPVVLKMRGGH